MPAFRSDPLDELVIPGGTHVEEHDLVTEGDVIVGGQSTVEFGVRGRNVIAGERVTFGGHIEAEGDCRLDMWCSVADNVLVGEDAYLGERVSIGGELRVAGNLDIGDDVDIEDGFEANGWIVIRNPMPTIVFLFVYLSQLLRIGEEEKAEEMLSAVLDDGEKRDHEPVLIPRGSRVSDDAWQVSAPGRIGDGCRLHGNVRAESLVVGRDNEIFGSLRAREGITVGSGTEVTGNVTTKSGTVRVGPDANIRGDVSGDYVEVHHEATVEGSIRASEEMSMVSEPVIDNAVVGGSEEAVEAAADHADQAAEQDDTTAQADEEEERPEPATAEDGDAAD
ncbi:acyltransferase [Halobacteriales archaeon SW_7_65_23]|nr:MAG: acyltransferase [Halobacteriales archaeon SW_7_65_23]